MNYVIDILVAVRDEEENIHSFINEIKSLSVDNVILRLLFLEDGSSDNTVKILKEVSQKENNVNYISLVNPYGQYAALTFGMTVSDADALITMDVDLGHPIEIVKDMIDYFCKGYNVVQGVRISYKRRKVYRSIGSFLYNLLFFIITGVNFFKQNVMFRLLDRKAKDIFLKNKNWWHIFRTNFKNKDKLKIAYIYYNAPERQKGKSKYNFFKLLFMSYKSIFAIISPLRFFLINILLILFIIYTFLKLTTVISAIITLIFLISFISFIMIRSFYPIGKIKIIETSLNKTYEN